MNITLLEFLKKYSTVNNKFLEDFYNLFDIKDPTKFCINLEKLILWLNCRKDHIKETLKKTYKKNIDYQILKQVENKTAGKPKEIIMLTANTAKLISMKSKGSKADEVRNYYITLEKLIDKYKDHIINSMDQKIIQLQNNQKPKVNVEKGVIYVIKAYGDSNDLYKIGKTKNLAKRLNGYNSGRADDLVPLLVFETDDIDLIENCVKSLLKKYQYRKHKEIYEADIDSIKKALESCYQTNKCIELIETNKTHTKTKAKYKTLDQKGGLFIGIFRK
jgi:phage anti-repressor protein